ncbi:hypothetical protein [Marinobacter subterrani]|uniref:Alpha/beta hydrolase family n=1 Tax=Marinobacter subterrani TaxID=1658765 RepID=A0A0J7JC70_9GAMM|nr:hypothetical protein [Marinobacter subterrani]KMQ75421.1 Alpha/beta hydrolase family [Marinobacter subterrani]
MFKKTLISLAVASSVGLTGCLSGGDEGANANPEYQISNPAIDGKVWPQFNPVTGQLPIPNDLIFQGDDLATVNVNEADGTFKVADSTPPVTTALNKLSGASTVAPIDIAMNGMIDADSVDGQPFVVDANGDLVLNSGVPIPNPKQNVFLLELDYASGDPLQALSLGEPPTIPLALPFVALKAGDTSQVTAANTVARAAVDQYKVSVVTQSDDEGEHSVIRINLLKPLDPKKRYLVVVTKDVTAGGEQIIASPSYANATDATQPLGSSNLEPVRKIINSFWEPVAENYFGLTNSSRAANSLPALSAKDIAFSISLTTSADEEILPYMAQPNKWFTDQLRSVIRLGAVRKVAGAASVLSKVSGGMALEDVLKSMRKSAKEVGPNDTNGNGVIDALDFDFNGDNNLTPADFNLSSTGDTASSPFNYYDVQAAIAAAEGAFPPPALSAALPTLFGSGAPCDTGFDTGTTCGGTALAGNYASLLPSIGDKSASVSLPALSSGSIAALLTPAVSSVTGSSTALVLQGSISIPYFLGVPSGSDGSTINTSTWTANHALAEKLNQDFGALGLQLAQGVKSPLTGDYASDAVNYLFPFPAKTGTTDQKIPMLVMLPRPGVATDGGAFTWDGSSQLPVVVFQHGITTDRSAALSVGSTLTSQGYGVVAIDLPLHGIDAQDQSDKTSGTAQEQQALASALLKGFDSQSGGAVPSQNTSANVTALISQTYLSQVIAFLQAAPYSCTSSDPATIAGGGGGCANSTVDALAAKFVGFAIGAQNSVKNYTSVIPGIARTSFERHFNFTADASGNPTAMNFDTGVGSSGSLYINLQNFFNSRDKNLESQIDLVNLVASLGGIKPTGSSGPIFDPNNVFMVGHSLGTVAATGAAATLNQSTDLPDVVGTVLYAPASGITRMLENSPSFASLILNGLAAKGVEQGSANYETFMRVVQNAIDPADPINLADDLAGSGKGVLAFNVVGTEDGNGNTLYKSDQTNVIEAANTQLNSAFPDYLAGALPLSEELGAKNVVSISGGEKVLATDLAYGNHGMFVLPSENSDIKDDAQRAADFQRQSDAFKESLLETAEFLLNDGTLMGPVDADTGRMGSPSTTPILDSRDIPNAQDVIDSDNTDELKQLN